MHERLMECILPVDHLLEESYERLKTEMGSGDKITLALVQNQKVVAEARNHILKLLTEKEKYGYLYYLADQKLLMPLTVRFKPAQQFIHAEETSQIIAKMQAIASTFACKYMLVYEITLVELFYFFIKLKNPRYTWLAMESQINIVPLHGHLIMSLERNYHWEEKAQTIPPDTSHCTLNISRESLRRNKKD